MPAAKFFVAIAFCLTGTLAHAAGFRFIVLEVVIRETRKINPGPEP